VTPGAADAVQGIVRLMVSRQADLGRPLFAALDGRSGTGKSTLAAAIAEQMDCTVIDGDAFYAGGTGLRAEDPLRLAAICIDWKKQRRVLQRLRSGQPARFRPFDWDAFDGSLAKRPVVLRPARFVLLEGVYAARTELAYIIDLRILLRTTDAVRAARLRAREGTIGAWERQWHAAEAAYFDQAAAADRFDLVIDN